MSLLVIYICWNKKYTLAIQVTNVEHQTTHSVTIFVTLNDLIPPCSSSRIKFLNFCCKFTSIYV